MVKKGGAPKGNNNAAKAKIWSDAIRKSVLSRKLLGTMADKLVELALTGDLPALKEVGDRLEGKVPQGIEGGGPNGELIIKFTSADKGVL